MKWRVPSLSWWTQNTPLSSLAPTHSSSSRCPSRGCVMLLSRNLAVILYAWPWIPGQPAGEKSSWEPLGKRHVPSGQTSFPVRRVRGQTQGEDHAVRVTWKFYWSPCWDRARRVLSTISRPGFKDRCCPSEKPFSCLCGDVTPSRLIWSDSLKTLTAKPPFFPLSPPEPLLRPGSPPAVHDAAATPLAALRWLRWCHLHLRDSWANLKVSLFALPFSFPLIIEPNFLDSAEGVLLAHLGEGDARPCVHTHRAPDRAGGAAPETRPSSRGGCPRGWCGGAEVIFLAWLGRLRRSLERMWCHQDPLR